jgi:hypothetical protein
MKLKLILTTAITAAAVGGLLADQAVALPSACSQSGRTVTCTYTSGLNPFTVPAGVFSIHVGAVGGTGSNGWSANAGGGGARVEADLAVTSGTTLYAVVGGNGMGREPGANGGGRGGIPDFCDLIEGCPPRGAAGGGGGASDLRTSQDDPSSRLLVAGGGGGGGGDSTPTFPSNPALGGMGGNGGGGNGWYGANGECLIPFFFPGGIGGTGGAAPGAVGSDGGQGGIGTGAVTLGCVIVGGGGGGGGGGLHGGAGGGGGASSAGGGGGGGSNLVPPGGSQSVDTTGIPLIKIAYVHGRPTG